LKHEELVAALREQADGHDPSRIVRILEPIVGDRRRERIRQVLDQRLLSVGVLFDSPYDPHNGAAVLRSCEAFGVARLHIVERARTPFLAASSVARGSNKWVDVLLHQTAQSAIDTLRAEGMELVAAHPEGELAPEDLASIPKVCIVLGNERDGIQDVLAKECRRRVRVPMRGFVESLNVSVTSALLLYAATRGRPGDIDDALRLQLYARALYFSSPRAEEILRAAP
jgi:tRNA (guanosine-2'-O-)-methyltransferase